MTQQITHRRRLALAALVGLAGLAISLLSSWLLWVRERQLAEVQFKLDAEKRIEAIKSAAADRLRIVNITAAFFSGSQLVDRREFATFAGPLVQHQKGVEALAWAPRIPAQRREAHEKAIQDEGLSTYEIIERDRAGQFVRSGERDEYYPIIFFEPSAPGPALLGLDLGSEPNCRRTIQKAVSSGGPVAALCPSIHGATDKHPLLYVVEHTSNEIYHAPPRPADQPEFDGFVVGVFRVCEIVENALSVFTPVGIDIHLSGSAADGDTSIYHRLSPLQEGANEGAQGKDTEVTISSSGISVTSDFDFAGLRCKLTCRPTAICLARHKTWGPVSTLVIGIVITVLLVGYYLLLAGRTARVEQLVAERTSKLVESEQRFRLLVDNAGDAFFLHDEQGNILDVSRRACESLGYTRDELLSMTVVDIDVDFVPKQLGRYSQRPTGEYPVTFEGRHRRKDGSIFPVEIRLAPLELGGRRLLLALARDITERKKLEESVQAGQLTLRAVLDQTFQFIGLMTPEGILTAANKTALAFSGVSEQDVLNKPFWETPWWTHSAELQEELRQAVKRAAGGDFVRMEVTHRAANGDLHWVDFSLKPVKDQSGKVIFLIPEGRDITDRKKAEEMILQEQRLLRDLLDLQERDRKLVAYEIHDGLAQQLTGAMYKFQAVDQTAEGLDQTVRRDFDDGLKLLREAMQEARRLIGGLRPPVLDKSGVVVAIAYLISETQQYGGPEIEFLHSEDFGRLAPPLESALFRIVQECLTNACRHSRSDRIRIDMTEANGWVRVEVRDWGVGFDPSAVQEDHFGLRGIRERARLLGGNATIHSTIGRGTRIVVELPATKRN